MRKVVICQHRLLHYRVRLFDELRESCARRGIDVHLVHGEPTRREQVKRDHGSLQWATQVRNRVVEIAKRDILWQPFPREHLDASLIVLMQENRLISNYPWLFRIGSRLPARIAFWGHGRNFQSESPRGLREWWKRKHIGLVDWWFAYTDMTRDILLQDGYPAERITVLNNAIDNEGFVRDLESVDQARIGLLRKELGINAAARVGLFCGSLYPEKRLDLLLDAADLIRSAFSDFHLVVIGDGPSASMIRDAAAERPWLHPVGVRKGAEKAAYFRLGEIVLNPGLVGLHVLDSFCAGLPMITTRDALHSPEIAYLKDGVNGLIAPGDSKGYADAVVALLTDRERLSVMGQTASEDARRYSLDNMVERFADGIQRCLAKPLKSATT